MPIVVPEYLENLTFNSYVELAAYVGESGLSWTALTSFIISGMLVELNPENNLFYVKRYVGEPNVPSDIRRLRKYVLEVMHRMGQPVIVKHMWNDYDARIGVAKPTPIQGTYESAYGQQVRNKDPFSYGTGYCSTELSPNEWIDPNSGKIIVSDTSPGIDFAQAPMYRGYGPGFVTYIIEPDTPVDLFKLAPSGALIRTQSQKVVSSWFPEINDNDLLINVELQDGLVSNAHERYQAKQTAPISIRGLDRKGRRETTTPGPPGFAPFQADHGNRHVVNQNFEMNAVLSTSVLFSVEIDR